MLNERFRQFKSGTDIRGVATEGVAGQPVNLTDEVIERMADGFVLWLAEKVGKAPDALKISVGRDSRVSGPHIMALTTARFQAAGAAVLRCGLASTPSMFMTTVDLGCDGALQITASHHPYNRNGLKCRRPARKNQARGRRRRLRASAQGLPHRRRRGQRRRRLLCRPGAGAAGCRHIGQPLSRPRRHVPEPCAESRGRDGDGFRL